MFSFSSLVIIMCFWFSLTIYNINFKANSTNLIYKIFRFKCYKIRKALIKHALLILSLHYVVKTRILEKDWNVRIFFVKRIYLQLCLCITVSSRWQEGWKSCLSNFYSRENLSSNSVSLLKRKLIYLGKVFLMFTQPLLHLFIVLYKLSYGIVCEDPYYTQYVSSYLFVV